MANLIVARDVQTKNFTTISEDWLTRFPGEFEKVRDALDPITDEEIEAEQAEQAEAAEQREAEIADAVKAAKQAAKQDTGAGAGAGSGVSTRDQF